MFSDVTDYCCMIIVQTAFFFFFFFLFLDVTECYCLSVWTGIHKT